MTDDRITARNRANAQKSTGPKTPLGKATVAGNALRHGATARPDPKSVAAWLEIILDRPTLGLLGSTALALREAGVRKPVLLMGLFADADGPELVRRGVRLSLCGDDVAARAMKANYIFL